MVNAKKLLLVSLILGLVTAVGVTVGLASFGGPLPEETAKVDALSRAGETKAAEPRKSQGQSSIPEPVETASAERPPACGW